MARASAGQRFARVNVCAGVIRPGLARGLPVYGNMVNLYDIARKGEPNRRGSRSIGFGIRQFR